MWLQQRNFASVFGSTLVVGVAYQVFVYFQDVQMVLLRLPVLLSWKHSYVFNSCNNRQKFRW